jgi:hypothetical protein
MERKGNANGNPNSNSNPEEKKYPFGDDIWDPSTPLEKPVRRQSLTEKAIICQEQLSSIFTCIDSINSRIEKMSDTMSYLEKKMGSLEKHILGEAQTSNEKPC